MTDSPLVSAMSSSWLSWLVPQKFDHIEDDRGPPWYAFSVQSNEISLEFQFYMPSIIFWIEIVVCIFMMSLLSVLISFIQYRYIVLPQKQRPQGETASSSFFSSTMSFLVGYGMILPFWICFPYFVCQLFDVRNLYMKFCLAVILPTLGIFRTTEAIYGCIPEHYADTALSYAFYCGSAMIIEYEEQKDDDNYDHDGDNQREKKEDDEILIDKNNTSNGLNHRDTENSTIVTSIMKTDTSQSPREKQGRQLRPVQATTTDLLRHVQWFVAYMFLLGAVQSAITPYDYQPFGSTAGSDGDAWYSVRRLMDLRQLGNNLVMATMLQLYLMTSGEGLIMTTVAITGCKCERFMDNPLMKSTSPSDFWGVRWNRVVHYVLKRGVYIPLRKRYNASKGFGVFMVFLASGLFHEWLLTFVFQQQEPEEGHTSSSSECQLPFCYSGVPLGGSTAFMLYNALIIIIEYAVRDWSFLHDIIISRIPPPMRRALIVMLGIPVAHWFCEPYVVTDYFHHASISLPIMKIVPRK